LLNVGSNGSTSVHRYYVSDESNHFTELGSRFLGRPIGSVTRVAL